MTGSALLTRKAAEIAFAAGLLAFGAMMIVGAREMETGWDRSGPEAGYFPLRIGILLVGTSLVILVRECLRPNGGQALIGRKGGANAALFALPLVALVAAVPWIGLYLAAAAYLLIAIGAVGRAPWRQAVAVALLTPTAMFALFEFAFRTPLPKGPLGPLFGML
jgi:hypothetical protein